MQHVYMKAVQYMHQSPFSKEIAQAAMSKKSATPYFQLYVGQQISLASYYTFANW